MGHPECTSLETEEAVGHGVRWRTPGRLRLRGGRFFLAPNRYQAGVVELFAEINQNR